MDFDSTGNGNASEFKEVIDKKIKIPGRFINYDVDRKMAIFESYGGKLGITQKWFPYYFPFYLS